MTLTFLIIFFGLILVALIGLLTHRIHQVTRKFDKLYNYFIRSEKDIDEKVSFISFMKGLPPTNSECPTKEELDKLD
jgi:hypothetical protein